MVILRCVVCLLAAELGLAAGAVDRHHHAQLHVAVVVAAAPRRRAVCNLKLVGRGGSQYSALLHIGFIRKK